MWPKPTLLVVGPRRPLALLGRRKGGREALRSRAGGFKKSTDARRRLLLKEWLVQVGERWGEGRLAFSSIATTMAIRHLRS